MKPYISLQPGPANEALAQVGRPGYLCQASRECAIWMQQLQHKFPVPDRLQSDCEYSVKSHPHEFGEYLEVVIFFNPTVSKAIDFAFRIQSQLPAHWDAEARRSLNIYQPALP